MNRNRVPASPEYAYAHVGPVQDGGAASAAFAELLRADCTEARAAELRKGLLDYCKLDTMAMARVVATFR